MLAVSLLYPVGVRPAPRRIGSPDSADLALDGIVRALDFDGRHAAFIAALLAELADDPATIAYRQQSLADLRRLPELAEGLAALLPTLRALDRPGGFGWRDTPAVVQVTERLAELDMLVSCADRLGALLDAADLRAPSTLALRAAVQELRSSPDYLALAAALPELRPRLDALRSVTLGVNLDSAFRPESATVLAINVGKFSGKGGLLDRLLGRHQTDEAGRGVGPLHAADADRVFSTEHALFRDLSHMLERALAPVIAALARYKHLGGQELAALAPELSLLLGACRLANEFAAAGLALCLPEIAPAAERIGQIAGGYSLDLALRLRQTPGGSIVPNDLAFDADARLLLLTGPNSGGKTTYTRAAGQAIVLFQAGLFVPGRAARISPVDAIFSHFATAERPEQEGGRLAEELQRLQTIFAHVTPQSLLLINEPFTSTDYAAARVLGRDLLAALRLLDARGIFVTHLHELVEEAIPTGEQHEGVASLVALAAAPEAAAPTPTFRVTRGRPQVQHYARELARRYGLSYAQLAEALRARGVIED